MIKKQAESDLSKKKTFVSAILAFIKVGIIGFGGGSALIPVIEKELVQKEKVVSSEEYTKHTIIANITPGTLPTKLAALSAADISVPAAYAYTLPGVILLIVLLGLLSVIGNKAVNYIEYASVGISAFIIFLLVEYVMKVMQNGRLEGRNKWYMIIVLVAFLVTGGKEIRSVLSVLIGCDKEWLLNPILDISTINLMIVSFFVILFLGKHSSAKKKIIACLLSGMFVLCVGKKQIFPAAWNMKLIIEIAMAVALVGTFLYEFFWKKDSGRVEKTETVKHTEEKTNYRKIIRNIGIFIILAVVVLIITIVATTNLQNTSALSVTDYTVNSAVSTVTSFGGGEAFISIAEGMFVNTGYVEPDIYYSQIVSIANALPGPILVKIIAAVGFEFGKISYNSSFIGILIAVLGTCVAIGVSSIVALLVYLGFDKLKDAPRIHQIQNYILPVVCGMLVSTCLSMLNEAQKIFTGNYGKAAAWPGTIVIAVVYLVVSVLSKKKKWSDIKILLSVAAITEILFLLCNVVIK